MSFTEQSTPAAQAAEWLVRLQSDAADEADWLAFEVWLGASGVNWAAYDRLEALSAEIDARAEEVLAALRAADNARIRAQTVWRRWAVAGIAAAAAGLLAWIAWPSNVAPQVFKAGRGQIREIALDDGTRVTLDAESRIEVALDPHVRRVTMGDGEAVFDVARDVRRPFLIAVGDRTVKVVGTEFNLAHRDRELDVTVTRGVVEVAPRDGAQGDVVRLVRGRRLTHEVGSPGQKVEVVATPENAFSWRKLRLIYDNAPLEEVVADFNRYFPRQLALDGETKQLRFSGVLVVTDEDAVLRRLEELLPVAVNRSGDTLVLRRRKASN